MTTLIPSIVIPLEDLVSNLSGARTYAAAYFLPEIASSAPPQDLVRAIDYAHSYLVRSFPCDFTVAPLTAYL